MGLLDRLNRTKPEVSAPQGKSGRYHSSGFLQYDEINNQLTGLQGLDVFEKMWRTDPDVRKTLMMIVNPIASATWTVEPYGGSEASAKDIEVAEFVRWSLFENMRPRFSSHVEEALKRAGRSGFCPFEVIWELGNFNGKQVYTPTKLALRLPRSIYKWNENEIEELISIEQNVLGANGIIDAENMLYYRFGAEGNNWEGESLLRPAYKPWKLKTSLEIIDSIAHERFAVGIPTLYPPTDATAAQLNEMENVLAGIRANQQGYIIAPGPHAENAEPGEGWRLEILTPNSSASGNTVNLMDSLSYHRDGISAAMIQEFMRLGQSGVGARATAETQANPFLAWCESIASSVVEDTFNEQLIPRLVGLNYQVDGLPRLKASLIDSTTLTELAGIVEKLVKAGAITADAELEDYLRERADLPSATADVDSRNNTATPTPPPAAFTEPVEDTVEDTNTKLTLAAAQSRDLRSWEKIMQLDRIETTIDSARERFLTAGQPASYRIAVEAAATAAKGKPVKYVQDNELYQALLSELEGIYLTGEDTVRQELLTQARTNNGAMSFADQPTSNDQIDPADADQLAQRAEAATQAVQLGIITAVTRQAITDKTPAALQAAGEAAARGALRTEAQEHAAPALNLGRQQTADRNSNIIVNVYYTSILDKQRCSNCNIADDGVGRPMEDPVRLTRQPPNPSCLGGGKCRCMEFYELDSETHPANII